MSIERRAGIVLRMGLLAGSVQLGWGCQARRIDGVQCGSDADCGAGSVCADYACVPAPAAAPEPDSASTLPGAPPSDGSLLDDFEQPNGMPSDSRFGRWFAGVFSSDDCKEGQTGQADAALVDGRLDFSWRVSDNRDGVDCYPAVGVVTEPFAATIDLSDYGSIQFDVRYMPNDASCVRVDRLSVSVVCEPAIFDHRFPTPAGWQTVSVPWTDFVQPDWALEPSVTIDACLHRIENISLSPVPNLLDGQCQAGVIAVDSIWLTATAAP